MQQDKSSKTKSLFEFGLPQTFKNFTAETHKLRHHKDGHLRYAGIHWPQFMPERVGYVLNINFFLWAGVAGLFFYCGGGKTTLVYFFVPGCIAAFSLVPQLSAIKQAWYFENGCLFGCYYAEDNGRHQTLKGGEIFIKPAPGWFADGCSLPWLVLPLSIADIASIETVPMKNMAGGQFETGMPGLPTYHANDVVIFFENGEAYPVATNMDSYASQVLTIQLNEALAVARMGPYNGSGYGTEPVSGLGAALSAGQF